MEIIHGGNVCPKRRGCGLPQPLKEIPRIKGLWFGGGEALRDVGLKNITGMDVADGF